MKMWILKNIGINGRTIIGVRKMKRIPGFNNGNKMFNSTKVMMMIGGTKMAGISMNSKNQQAVTKTKIKKKSLIFLIMHYK
jgi:hypothetical protein